MKMLFFELLQVAIGRRDSLSRVPSAQEWSALYGLAVKQALAGVCFCGLKRLDDGQLANLPAGLKMQWVGLVVQVQRQNDVVRLSCAELSRRLSEEGYANCLLKGQAFASLYPSYLRDCRQPGDIDMWILTSPKEAIAWARETGKMSLFDYHHADLNLYSDVEVELHYRPSISRNLVRNARLQNWFEGSGREHIDYSEELGCYVPDETFNIVLCLNHIFCHLMFEGVGLRQLMDLYFILQSGPVSAEVVPLLRHLGLLRFAAAVMWVEREVFGLEDKYMLCEPDEKSGRFFLDEILRAGNFGHYDDRIKGIRNGNRLQLMFRWIKHSLRLFWHYPLDVLWTPFGIVWFSLWRRLR